MGFINPLNFYLLEIGQFDLPSSDSEECYNLISKFAVSLPPCELRETIKDFINHPHETHRKIAVYEVHPEIQLEEKHITVFEVFNSFKNLSPNNLIISDIEIFLILYSSVCREIRTNLTWDYHKILTAMNWFLIAKDGGILAKAIGLNTSYGYNPGPNDFGWYTKPFDAQEYHCSSFSSGWYTCKKYPIEKYRIKPYPKHRFVIPIT